VKQKGCVRIEGGAQVVKPVLDVLDQVRAANDGARNNIRMTVQVLGATMKG